jgi:hypothetical protein
VSATPALHLTGSNIVPRDTAVTLSKSRDLSVDAISLSGPFNLGFYRQFVRDAFESPGAMRALRRWTVAPKVYVRTVDEAGKPIETPTIDLVRTVLAEDQSVWTGGRFGIASVDAGTQTREGVPGWITVKFPSEVDPHVCGRAQVAQSGGWIELDYKNNECTCHGPSRIDAIVVRHELGHAFGFYHTGDRRDLMSGLPWDCSVRLTAREQFHASVAYTREPGNADQDVDAATATLSVAPAPIVVN